MGVISGVIVVAFVDGESPTGKSYRDCAMRSVFYRDAVLYSTDQVKKMLALTGFTVESVRQTLFGHLTGITEVQPWREGCGEGAFVVMRGTSTCAAI